MKKILVLLVFLPVLLTGCFYSSTAPENNGSYRPVYLSKDSVSMFSVGLPKPTVEAGKIYVYGNYIFQNEVNQGFHVIDNTDKGKPMKVAFYKLPLCTEISIRNNHLYTNNMNDLVVIDLHNILKPTLVKRIPNAFPTLFSDMQQNFPTDERGVYFECPDPGKGVVVKWEKTVVTNAKCRTQ